MDWKMNNESSKLVINSLDAIVKISSSKECGASKLIVEYARKIGLDDLISSKSAGWREDVLAMIAAMLLYSLNETSAADAYAYSTLWEHCGHPADQQPDIHQHCSESLAALLADKEPIQQRLARKSLSDRRAILYDLTFTGLSDGFGDLRVGLLTNSEGCPFGIEFLSNVSDDAFKNCIESIVDKYELQSLELLSEIQSSARKEIRTIFQYEAQKSSEADTRVDRHRILTQMVQLFKKINSDPDEPVHVVCDRLFLATLAGYLQWHMDEELKLFLKDKPRDWELASVFERLMSIRSQSIRLGDTAPAVLKNQADVEQMEMISLFGFDANDFSHQKL